MVRIAATRRRRSGSMPARASRSPRSPRRGPRGFEGDDTSPPLSGVARSVAQGVTLTGRLFDEGALVRIGMALESELSVWSTRPTLWPSPTRRGGVDHSGRTAASSLSVDTSVVRAFALVTAAGHATTLTGHTSGSMTLIDATATPGAPARSPFFANAFIA